MTERPSKLKNRAERKHAKREEKKRQIANSAIAALQELGYANTSLRDIAANSDMSLGILHYYFENRTDLIIYCVRVYKQDFAASILVALENAIGREAVIENLSGALASSLAQEARIHRLWYDIRNQALFDEAFRPVTAEIEAMLVTVVSTAFVKSGQPAPQMIGIQFALLDGVFRHLLMKKLNETDQSASYFKSIFASVLEQVL